MNEPPCPFCFPAAERLFHIGERILGIWDGFPASPGHALLVPKRHVGTWFEASREEQLELTAGIRIAHDAIAKNHRPDGFNIGVNVGPAAGQTVSHLHVHVIPRYAGDVPDPRGGVRHVIPGRANYLLGSADPGGGASFAADSAAGEPGLWRTRDAAFLGSPPHRAPLVAGDRDDPLLPHLLSHLAYVDEFDVAVAFVLPSGVDRIREHLRDLLRRGGRARILTGDYLDVTDPTALRSLLDLAEEIRISSEDGEVGHTETHGMLDLRIFDASQQPFHPKAYVFRDNRGGGVAYVGSSNLSRAALEEGVEWNYRVVPSEDHQGFRAVEEGFERLFQHPRTLPLDHEWIDAYVRRRRAVEVQRPADTKVEPPMEPPNPHEVQRDVLAALATTRAAGNHAGLVVLATGLGKTWLAAFDTASSSDEFRRVLFVAHREEILTQAMDTFRRIRPEAHLGLYTGDEKNPGAEVVFASVQTLGRNRHLETFDEGAFDYIVIDEFHHAAAATYRRILDHFTPRFLLGLTATPERTDGGDLLAFCGENLVYRCDLTEGIRRGLLSPFHYFGVPDEVDYANIPWRSHRFDEKALENALATHSRAANALDQWRTRVGQHSRTLAFCCSKRHADFMADFFRERGVRVASVHSGTSSDPRAASLEHLQSGELEVIFAVDLFNEGVDLPSVDAVLMLRPTESRILWLQQFGRGLRRAPGKERLTVIDYIGNHRTFLTKPQALLGLGSSDSDVARALDRLQAGEFELPPGCEITYELEAVEILRGLLRLPKGPPALRAWYEDFRERTGERPRAVEAFHEGYNPRVARRTYGSWCGLVRAMHDLPPDAESLASTAAGRFLEELEVTPMTKSFKMLVVLAMLNADLFPGQIDIDTLVGGFVRLAGRSPHLRDEVEVSLDDQAAVERYLERNPIDAWIGGKGTGTVQYFEYDERRFRTIFDVPQNSRDAFQSLVREIVDWRLAEYLERGLAPAGADRFECKISHSGGRPILFLPDRDEVPGLPRDRQRVRLEDDDYEADFGKIAVNVLRKPGAEENVLPGIVRRWFGPDAGLPGTQFRVVFTRAPDGCLILTPVGGRIISAGLELWRPYAREAIPEHLGVKVAPRMLQSGVVRAGANILLFVTLEKQGLPEAHRYKDRFLSPQTFQWQTQNRTRQEGGMAQKLRSPVKHGVKVHLFVRRRSKEDGVTAPFFYCGQPEFVDWEGEKPITIRWRLTAPVPGFLHERLRVPNDEQIGP